MDATVSSAFPFDPQRPRRPGDVWDEVKGGLDLIAHNLPQAHKLLVRLNPYPRPWRPVDVACRDGACLSGWYAKGRDGGPAVLIAPGTFQTKDDTPRKRRAIDLWRRLGAHVLIVDMRGFGGSAAFPGTAGHLESFDLHDAADWLLRESGASRVTLWGESLGGAVALVAGCKEGAEERFERILAWSAFADLEDASRVSERTDPRGQTLIGRAYRAMIRLRSDRPVESFRDWLTHRATELGLEPDEMFAAGSPVRHVESLRVPAHCFHAEDDPIVPVTHARRLEATGAPRLHVHVLPRGAHLSFDRTAPAWYAAITKGLVLGRA